MNLRRFLKPEKCQYVRFLATLTAICCLAYLRRVVHLPWTPLIIVWLSFGIIYGCALYEGEKKWTK